MSITAEEIEKWAKANPARAVEFGRLLFKVYMGQAAPETKFGRQPEDNYADWARANKMAAMNLFVKLQGQIIGKK